jgi:hypothetical protein
LIVDWQVFIVLHWENQSLTRGIDV